MRSESNAPAEPVLAAGEKATKQRLLDAAVRLFAERGFQGASVRAVTEAAGASVSAANYHFGSKEEMLRAAIVSRATPLNERRLEALAAVERGAGQGGAPTVEEVVRAFVYPILEMRAEANSEETAYRGLAARLYVDPPAAVAQIRREVFEPVNERFREVLSRALPDASPEEVALSLQLGLGVLVHMLSGNAELAGSSENALEDLFDTLVTFSAAGIKAVCCESASGNSRGPIDAGSAGEDS